jgi:hypothetical protein
MIHYNENGLIIEAILFSGFAIEWPLVKRIYEQGRIP